MREYLAATAILLRNKNEVLNSRAGEAPNKTGQRRYMHYRGSSCMYPFRQLCVQPGGKVSLCCEDVSGRVTLGDVSKDTIKSVWNNPAFTAMRKILRTKGRTALEPCLGCDYGHLGVDKAKTLLRHFVGSVFRF
jgi:radical SAM protein with 4Fe4S-binding SPASM domain